MRRLLRSQKGQSFVELALVVFLFTLFIIGIMQFVMLGTAQIRCQLAARRAAWHISNCNHLDFQPHHRKEVNALAPGFEIVENPGNQQKGKVTKISTKVRAIGFFHWVNPDGFTITAQSSVIAYNPSPIAPKLVKKGFAAINEFWEDIK
ncbi:pilus assembly protein [bacterium]|nr:pilus assembly protein [bacterium]